MADHPTEQESTNEASVPVPNINAMSNVLDIYAAFHAIRTADLTNAQLMEMAKAQFEINEKRRVSIAPTAIIEWPKDVRSALKELPKLTSQNWRAWLLDFEQVWEGMPTVYGMLFGDIDECHPSYNKQLDQKLVQVLRQVSDKESSDNIRDVINRNKWTSGRKLFNHMQTRLTKNEDLMASTILADLSRIRMVNNDAEKVIQEINDVVTRASLVGIHITEAHMITTLENITQYTEVYSDVWTTLESVGTIAKWDSVCAAVMRRQVRHDNETLYRMT